MLSRLAIDTEEMADYTRQFNDFLAYVDNLAEADTDQVKPTAHVLPLKNVFRADEVKPSLSRELALSNAPLREDGYFKVPKILED